MPFRFIVQLFAGVIGQSEFGAARLRNVRTIFCFLDEAKCGDYHSLMYGAVPIELQIGIWRDAHHEFEINSNCLKTATIGNLTQRVRNAMECVKKCTLVLPGGYLFLPHQDARLCDSGILL